MITMLGSFCAAEVSAPPERAILARQLGFSDLAGLLFWLLTVSGMAAPMKSDDTARFNERGAVILEDGDLRTADESRICQHLAPAIGDFGCPGRVLRTQVDQRN